MVTECPAVKSRAPVQYNNDTTSQSGETYHVEAVTTDGGTNNEIDFFVFEQNGRFLERDFHGGAHLALIGHLNGRHVCNGPRLNFHAIRIKHGELQWYWVGVQSLLRVHGEDLDAVFLVQEHALVWEFSNLQF